MSELFHLPLSIEAYDPASISSRGHSSSSRKGCLVSQLGLQCVCFKQSLFASDGHPTGAFGILLVVGLLLSAQMKSSGNFWRGRIWCWKITTVCYAIWTLKNSCSIYFCIAPLLCLAGSFGFSSAYSRGHPGHAPFSRLKHRGLSLWRLWRLL